MKFKKKRKYNNVKTIIDGISFDSESEALYYFTYLKPLVINGIIKDLKIHPKYNIYLNNKRICSVILDFEYIENEIRRYIDVKGYDTSISRLKRKLFEAQYEAEVELITK